MINYIIMNNKKNGIQVCKNCGGDGFHMLPPYYATIMPKEEKTPCEDCKGRGRVFVVPNNIVAIREKDY